MPGLTDIACNPICSIFEPVQTRPFAGQSFAYAC